MVFRHVFTSFFDFVYQEFPILEVDNCNDDAGCHDEIEERDHHVECGVDEAVIRIVQSHIGSVVGRDHHQERVEDSEVAPVAERVVLRAVFVVLSDIWSCNLTERTDKNDCCEDEDSDAVEEKHASYFAYDETCTHECPSDDFAR